MKFVLAAASFFGLSFLLPTSALAQANANLQNNAAPTANSVTTGGTNVNYQTNNQWSNEVGFGPGIFCRTPTFYVGGAVGTTNNNQTSETFADTGNYAQNISGNVGILVPFGSTALRDCTRLGAQIVRDRQISTELSMIRACKSLKNEGIKVDPVKYPLLALCVDDNSVSITPMSTHSPSARKSTENPSSPVSSPKIIPIPNAMHDTKHKSMIESPQ